MASSNFDFLMCALSNDGARSSDRNYAELERSCGSLAKLFPLKVPGLLVGTLDSLMTCSEELQKADSHLRQICGNVARTHKEIARAVGKEVVEHVNGMDPILYVQRFTWDVSKFPYRQNRPDRLMTMLRAAASKIDNELRQLTSRYQELKVSMGASSRRQGGNLMVRDLSEVLGSDSSDLNSEYFTRVVVVVPIAKAEAWEDAYDHVDGDAVPYGPERDRWAVRGSPVVPGSLKKRGEDAQTALYTVIVLRKFLDSFKARCKEEHRAIVRDFDFDPEAKGKSMASAAKVERDYDVILMKLFRWCEIHFGECIMVWMHVKVLRLFVESVLRYGLPVDFTAALAMPRKGQGEALVGKLAKAYDHLLAAGGDGVLGSAGKGSGGGGSSSSSSSGTGGGETNPLEFFPFVAVPVEPLVFN